MYSTANFKEAYTSVLCLINYAAAESNEMQSWCMSTYQLISQSWWGTSSPSRWSRGFPVLTVSYSPPAVNVCTCGGLCWISSLHWLGCYDRKEDIKKTLQIFPLGKNWNNPIWSLNHPIFEVRFSNVWGPINGHAGIVIPPAFAPLPLPYILPMYKCSSASQILRNYLPQITISVLWYLS